MAGILDGKVALVTGGASGIGQATAVVMAREGARVAVADRAEADAAATVALINAAGGQAIAIGGDVTREADVAAMVARTVSAFGRIDCAFNNAGIAPRAVGPAGHVHELSQRVRRMLAVNLTGVFSASSTKSRRCWRRAAAVQSSTQLDRGLIGLRPRPLRRAKRRGGADQECRDRICAGRHPRELRHPGYITTPMTKETIEERGEEILAKCRCGAWVFEIAKRWLDVFRQGVVHDRRIACDRRRLLRGLRL
jgi:hypothetical protein